MSLRRLLGCSAVIIGSAVVLTLTLSASAGTRHANAHPDLDKTAACIRAALRKEKLAIEYILEGKVADKAIANKVIQPATADIFSCAAHALKAAEDSDEISKEDAKSIDEDITDAAAADDDARHFLAAHKGKQAITSLVMANSLKKSALSAIELFGKQQPKPAVSPILAVFLPKPLATKYSIRAIPGATYRWTLTLQQIDPDKSTPAGFQSSNPSAPNYASAGFDPKCNNSYLPNGKQTASTGSSAAYVWSSLQSEFTWYHGDVGSYPGSNYGCDHTKMGARGHQGIVTVVVIDGHWACKASIEGTNLTQQTEEGDKPDCKYAP